MPNNKNNNGEVIGAVVLGAAGIFTSFLLGKKTIETAGGLAKAGLYTAGGVMAIDLGLDALKSYNSERTERQRTYTMSSTKFSF